MSHLSNFPQTESLSNLRKIANDYQLDYILTTIWNGSDLVDAIQKVGLLNSKALLFAMKIDRELRQKEKEGATYGL